MHVFKHTISPAECGYTYKGANLAAMRRTELRDLARRFDIVAENDTKDELLGMLLASLKMSSAPSEIEPLVPEKPKNAGK